MNSSYWGAFRDERDKEIYEGNYLEMEIVASG